MSSDSTDLPRTGTNSIGSDDLDTLMELLADHRRRYALYYLRKQESEVEIDELASRIAEWDSDDRERILTELRHKHLPKMEEVGIIERDGDEVRREDTNDPIDRYLDIAGEVEKLP
ncbi:hypothetical protein SAMN05421858_1803 [Haladaptatus litoreus]|uniref:DUF7344 domain-containing protein n=1 Tax=Haladaptatus litoreus TaxID=553468 RepID=A0A1N6YZV3_9EURY|nr:hypothetical protein [Haladaptatus litoreus]SIR20070.1 hypothetical protein SAMN05421858_1803 [Haladaptatus litoreus]